MVEVSEDVLSRTATDEDSELWSALTTAVLASVRLITAGPCDPVSRHTRLGGTALVGAEFAWPRTDDGRPLCLVGQLNSDEINQAAGRDALPPGVLLVFFYDAEEQQGWGFDPRDRQY